MYNSLEKKKDLIKAATQFRDGSLPLADPREDAAEVLTSLSNSLDMWSKDIGDVTKMSGSQYNTMLAMRRYVVMGYFSCHSIFFEGECI